MKKVICFALLLGAFGMASCTDKMVDASELPSKAQLFLESHFPDVRYSVFLDYDGAAKTYDVSLFNGAYGEFDSKGEWKKLSFDKGLPAAALPSNIVTYCAERFPAFAIVKMEREYRKYEVKLSNDMELVFDLEGNFVRFDE